jgi:hypothetical protein
MRVAHCAAYASAPAATCGRGRAEDLDPATANFLK